jgi:hypothetical protein
MIQEKKIRSNREIRTRNDCNPHPLMAGLSVCTIFWESFV